MSMQEIAVTNNQKKKILRAIRDQDVIFQDENGDIIVSVSAYQAYKEATEEQPLEDLLADGELADGKEFFVFI
ncbi:hypothetical protein SIN8267_01378 [Sinobacterium norvegicum]|uniref:Prevent-host-death protein n=1 Tax=Sinobacterium norvegicum TaxID=1641715 RepID=A0ABN8EG83_9GAMM|nr:hypothetical protein [Sinobacterium norvegicum]CAH0991276.1 hypothetical protein SIN8267_01378 [Sinobacterium norvegicum]